MTRLANNKRALIAVAIAVAIVAVVVPTCRMVGCSMDMTGYMGFMHPGSDIGFFSDCGGSWITSTAPASVVPTVLGTMLLALIALAASAPILFAPQLFSHPVLIVDAAPPPPPLDPRGMRFRI